MKGERVQREIGLINNVSRCFPLFWTECEVCGREFKFEIGWLRYTMYGDSRYYCRKCCKTKEDVVQNIRNI